MASNSLNAETSFAVRVKTTFFWQAQYADSGGNTVDVAKRDLKWKNFGGYSVWDEDAWAQSEVTHCKPIRVQRAYSFESIWNHLCSALNKQVEFAAQREQDEIKQMSIKKVNARGSFWYRHNKELITQEQPVETC